MPDPGDRTALVTGANTGIGRATARSLAAGGWRVTLACRSAGKGQETVDALRHATGNDAVDLVVVDLGDLSSVRACAAVLAERGTPLHVLVNNAGVGGQRGATRDGFELAFGINHLGHFALTTGLLPLLRAAAMPGSPARVVTVASDGHRMARGVDFDAVRRPTRSFTGLPEYAVSKLCNIVFSEELARRESASGVHAYAVHPGAVATDIYRRVPRPARALLRLPMRSPERGAEPSLHCATAGEAAAETGLYYGEDCRPRKTSEAATEELGKVLWDRSEEWAGAT